MITAFEVGALFTIQDNASPILDRIASQLDRVAALAKTAAAELVNVGKGVGLDRLANRLDRVEAVLGRVATVADTAGVSMNEAMTTAGSSAGVATEEVAALRAELVGASSAAKALGVSSMVGALRGQGGGHRGMFGHLRVGEGGVGFATGLSARAFGMPALVGSFAGYESIKYALTEDLALTKVLQTMHLPTSGPDSAQYKDQLRSIVQQTAEGTIFSQQEVANAAVAAAGMYGFTGQQGMLDFSQLFPLAARSAEVAQQFGLGPLNQNLKAFAQFAHLERRYTARELAPAFDEILNIAIATQTPIGTVEKSMAQALPMAVAAGASPEDTATLVGFLMRGGLGTRAGYSVGQLLLGLTKVGGPTAAHLGHGEPRHAGALETPSQMFFHPHHMTRIQESRHDAALTRLGVGPEGRDVMDATGHLILSKFIAALAHAAQTMRPMDFLGQLNAAFNTRGTRGGALIVKSLYDTFHDLVTSGATGAEMQRQQAQTPLQQLEQVWARLKDIGNTLGTSILPQIEKLVSALLQLVTGVDGFLSRYSTLARITTDTLTGAGVGWLVGGPMGAAIGGGTGAVYGGLTSLPSGKPAGPRVNLWVHSQLPSLYDPNAAKALQWDKNPSSITDAPVGSTLFHQESFTPGSDGVHIDNLVIHGAPQDADDAWVRRIAGAITREMQKSAMHNLGHGSGINESPFTQGASVAI